LQVAVVVVVLLMPLLLAVEAAVPVDIALLQAPLGVVHLLKVLYR
jgi:hypothetical protein